MLMANPLQATHACGGSAPAVIEHDQPSSDSPDRRTVDPGFVPFGGARGLEGADGLVCGILRHGAQRTGLGWGRRPG